MEPPSDAEAWCVYVIGPAEMPTEADIFKGIGRMCMTDRAAARSGLMKLLKHAATGRDPKTAYPTKCHEAFSFKHEGQQYKVWRIREKDVRIYFFYSAGKVLLLPHIGEKREDKLTKAQETTIAKPIKAYLDAQSKDRIHYEEYEDDHTDD